MRLIKILLCLLVFYPSWCYNDGEAGDGAVGKWQHVDFLAKLKASSSLHDKMKKYIWPRGSNQTAESIPPPPSHELGPHSTILLKAVLPFSDVMVNETLDPKMWYDILSTIDSSQRGLDSVPDRYKQAVTSPITKMRSVTASFLHVGMNVYEQYKTTIDLEFNCKFEKFDPESILGYLTAVLLEECGFSLTTKYVTGIAERRSILMRGFRRFKIENQSIPDPASYLTKFPLLYYYNFDNNDDFKDFEVFDKHFSTYEQAIDSFFNELFWKATSYKTHDEMRELRCLPLPMMMETSFNRNQIGLFLKKIQNDLTEIAFISGVCANTVYSEEESSRNEYAQRIANQITLISSHTSKWIDKTLATAWPAIHYQIMNEQIEDVIKELEDFDRESLKKGAEITNSILVSTGSPNYTYEMLIIRAPEDRSQFYFEGQPDYFYNKGGFGYNTVLVRRPTNVSSPSETVNHEKRMSRLVDYVEDLKISIIKEMKYLYKSQTVHEVAEKLQNKLGSFVSENRFNGFAIARKWEKYFFSSCKKIDDFLYSKDSIYGSSSVLNFTYQNPGSTFQRCETYNFYFFL